MRITASFALLLVLCCNFKTNQMAVIKGLGSQPETTEDCSGGETTRLPEVTNVRTKNPKTDFLNDEEIEENNGLKDKRCARIETISMNDEQVGVPLSLTRRDVSLEKLKQRCEACRNTNMCKKHKICTLCRSPCEKVEAAEATMTETPPETSTALPLLEITVGSRFGEEAEKSRYYSLGLIPPGPLLHLFAKAFNIPSEENFEKLIVLGKLRGAATENLDNLQIIDMAHVFGDHKQTFATVHQPINVDPAKIADLDRKLDEALTRRKQELNIDQLSNDQIREVINEVLVQMSQMNRPDKGTESVDEFVEAPETETKCSVDEAMNDLLEVIPMTAPERAKEETKPPQLLPQPQNEESEEKQQITNPPVIQDGLNMVGKTIEDDKDIKPSNTAEKIVDNPPEVLTVSGDVEPGPESDSQIQTRAGETPSENPNLAQNVFKTVEDSLKIASKALADEPQQELPESSSIVNFGKNVLETVEDGLKIASNDHEPAESVPSNGNLVVEDLAKNIFKTVQDGLEIPSTERRSQINASNEKVSEDEDLQKNVLQTVEDSLKVASDDDDLISKNTPKSKNVVEAGEPVFVQTDEEQRPSQVNANDLASQLQFPEQPSEINNQPVEVSNNDIFENPDIANRNQNEEITVPEKDNFMNIQENSMSSESIEFVENTKFIPVQNDPQVAETLPQVEIRGELSDESGSEEKLSSFGSLVPLKNVPEDGQDVKKLFFVGKDIKLPLQMFQDKDGVMQLRVDVNKLCHCKNTNCTRKHVTTQEVVNNKVPENNLETEEVKTRRQEQLMNSFVDQPHENSEIFKRSPKMDSEIEFSQKNTVDDEDKVKIDGVYKFQAEEEGQFEKELKKINDNLKEYFNTEDSLSLNKGNVALYKDVEKTKDVSRMITFANNLLVWMKDLAVNNLNS